MSKPRRRNARRALWLESQHRYAGADGGQRLCHELGLRSALARPLLAPVEDDGRLVRAVAAFLRQLRVPAREGVEP